MCGWVIESSSQNISAFTLKETHTSRCSGRRCGHRAAWGRGGGVHSEATVSFRQTGGVCVCLQDSWKSCLLVLKWWHQLSGGQRRPSLSCDLPLLTWETQGCSGFTGCRPGPHSSSSVRASGREVARRVRWQLGLVVCGRVGKNCLNSRFHESGVSGMKNGGHGEPFFYTSPFVCRCRSLCGGSVPPGQSASQCLGR